MNRLLIVTCCFLIGCVKSHAQSYVVGNDTVSENHIRAAYLRDIENGAEAIPFEQYAENYVEQILLVAEAKSQGLDKTKEHAKEISNITAKLINDSLRMQAHESKVASILRKRMPMQVTYEYYYTPLLPDALPADTLKAFKKAQNARQKVMAGTPIAEVSDDAETVMRHLGVGEQGKIVEDKAFSLPLNKLSEVFRTQRGFMFMKVTERGFCPGYYTFERYSLPHPTDTLDTTKLTDEILTRGNPTKLPTMPHNKVKEICGEEAHELYDPGAVSKPTHHKDGWRVHKLISRKGKLTPPEIDTETRRILTAHPDWRLCADKLCADNIAKETAKLTNKQVFAWNTEATDILIATMCEFLSPSQTKERLGNLIFGECFGEPITFGTLEQPLKLWQRGQLPAENLTDLRTRLILNHRRKQLLSNPTIRAIIDDYSATSLSYAVLKNAPDPDSLLKDLRVKFGVKKLP